MFGCVEACWNVCDESTRRLRGGCTRGHLGPLFVTACCFAVSEAAGVLVSARLLFGGLSVVMLVVFVLESTRRHLFGRCVPRGGFCRGLLQSARPSSRPVGCSCWLSCLIGGIVKCCEGVCVRVCAAGGGWCGGERLKEE